LSAARFSLGSDDPDDKHLPSDWALAGARIAQLMIKAEQVTIFRMVSRFSG